MQSTISIYIVPSNVKVCQSTNTRVIENKQELIAFPGMNSYTVKYMFVYLHIK